MRQKSVYVMKRFIEEETFAANNTRCSRCFQTGDGVTEMTDDGAFTGRFFEFFLRRIFEECASHGKIGKLYITILRLFFTMRDIMKPILHHDSLKILF